MAKLTLRQAARYVAECADFQASNLSGCRERDRYVVRSYGHWVIYVHVDGRWFGTIDRYSTTTACQMTAVRPVAGLRDIEWLSQDALCELARGGVVPPLPRELQGECEDCGGCRCVCDLAECVS